MNNYEKKYKEALERAKQALLDGTISSNAIAYITNIFPELKESEDEKIRKTLIEYFNAYPKGYYCGLKMSCIIAWLKKQSKEDVRYKYFDQLLAADDIYQMAMNDDMVQEAKTKAINALSELEIGKLLGIEKQGANSVSVTKGNTSVTNAEVVSYPTVTASTTIKPKFRIGDYLVNDYCKGKVIALTDDAYLLDTEQGIPFSYEQNAHLWTIQDAKPGDVLFHSDSASNGIFIFKELLKFEFGEKVICYCDYDSEDYFCLGEHHTCCWANAKILHPATKEQRDLLFAKIKEAGYEWDAEKKELKKIHVIGEGKAEMDYCFTKMMHGEKVSSNFSEEDEIEFNHILKTLISVAKEQEIKGYNNLISSINWFKSLKARVRPQ